MEKGLEHEEEWVRYEPSDGEDPNRAQSSPDAIKSAVDTPDAKNDAAKAPASADPTAGQANREFIEDAARRYDQEAADFVEGHSKGGD